jgi:hypothetical protein
LIAESFHQERRRKNPLRSFWVEDHDSTAIIGFIGHDLKDRFGNQRRFNEKQSKEGYTDG